MQMEPPTETGEREDLETKGASRPSLLLAEDDGDMRWLLVDVLAEEGYHVVGVADGLGLCRELAPQLADPASQGFDAIVSDVRMPAMGGIDVLFALRALTGFPPMILITAFGDEETHSRANDLGAVAILDKPFEIEELLEVVRSITAPR